MQQLCFQDRVWQSRAWCKLKQQTFAACPALGSCRFAPFDAALPLCAKYSAGGLCGLHACVVCMTLLPACLARVAQVQGLEVCGACIALLDNSLTHLLRACRQWGCGACDVWKAQPPQPCIMGVGPA